MFNRSIAGHAARVSVLLLLCASYGHADAQTAYRCEVNGSTVYTDRPCADGKAVAPTQDTPEQQKRADDAAKQVRADDQSVSQRIERRSADEAKERSEIRKLQADQDKRAAKAKAAEEKAAKKKSKKSSAVKKVAKAPKSKAAPSKQKKDNRGSSATSG